MVYKNSYSTATLTNGQWCAIDVVTDKDGIGVTKPSGANRIPIAGCVVESIPHQEFGLVQVWGFKSDARCLGGTGGSAASRIIAGGALKFGTSGFAAQNFPKNSAALKSHSGKFPVAVAIAPLNTAALTTQNTSGAYQVLIRCL